MEDNSNSEKLVDLNPDELSLSSKKILNFLKSEIKGQDRALEYLTDAYEIYQSGLRNPDRPIFVGLLLGPSGVGKTLVAEVLAKHFFGNKRAFTKLMCAEFSHGHEVSWLTGAPPGYIGFTHDPLELKLSQFNIDKFDLYHKLITGQLDSILSKGDEGLKEEIEEWEREKKDLEDRLKKLKENKKATPETIRHKVDEIKRYIQQIDDVLAELKGIKGNTRGYKKDISREELFQIYAIVANKFKFVSIILLDEIEKAHHMVYNHLLEIMDKGQLAVGGQITSFRNSFILMTANVGNTEIATLLKKNSLGFSSGVKTVDQQEVDEHIYNVANEAAKQHFSPEFLGRIDKIIVFRPLNRKVMLEIFDLELGKFHSQLLAANLPIKVHFTAEAKEQVVTEAMKYSELGARMIERRLDRDLKDALARLFNRGEIQKGDLVQVDFKNGKFIFQKVITKKLV